MTARIMTVYGTRPEAIKVAPVIAEIDSEADMENVVVVTGQHREMLHQVNSLFAIEPDFDLGIMTEGQSLNSIVARVISGLDEIIEKVEPDVIIVQGDTSTVLAAGLAAFNRKVPVVHLEAGLRSGDLDSPFPEEGNRRVTSHIATLHLAPTEISRSNLLRESIPDSSIAVTGNTVIDTLKHVLGIPVTFDDVRLQQLSERISTGEGQPIRVLLVTAHRRENHGRSMSEIGGAVAELASRFPEMVVVLPMHRNPRVREALVPALSGLDNVIVVEPLSYAEFTKLLSLSHIVLTDSGGVQEEAPSMGKPVLVMRNNTERPEAVTAGTVKLVGTDRKRIVDEVAALMENTDAYAAMARAVSPYGDGASASRVIDAIRELLAQK